MRKGLIRLHFIFVFLICSIGLFGINSNCLLYTSVVDVMNNSIRHIMNLLIG